MQDGAVFGDVDVLAGEHGLGALAQADEFRRDSDLFLEGTRTEEFQELTNAAMKRGFQTRDGEMDLARLVGEINEHRTE